MENGSGIIYSSLPSREASIRKSLDLVLILVFSYNFGYISPCGYLYGMVRTLQCSDSFVPLTPSGVLKMDGRARRECHLSENSRQASSARNGRASIQ